LNIGAIKNLPCLRKYEKKVKEISKVDSRPKERKALPKDFAHITQYKTISIKRTFNLEINAYKLTTYTRTSIKGNISKK